MTHARHRMRLLAGGLTASLVLAGPVSVAGLSAAAAGHDRSDDAGAGAWIGSVSADDIDCADLEAAREALLTARAEAHSARRAFARAARGSVVNKARAQRSSERRQARRALRQARRELGQLRRTYTSGTRVLARHGDWSGWDDDRDDYSWDDREERWSDDWSDRSDGGWGSGDTSGYSEDLRRALAALQTAREALAALGESDRQTLRAIIRELRAERAAKRSDARAAREALAELRERFRACFSDAENGDDDGSTDGDDTVIEVPNDPADQAPLPDDEATWDQFGDSVV